MTNITVKNIPEDLYEHLKMQAKKNRRSINNEIIYRLDRSLRKHQPDPDVFLERVRALREATSGYNLTDEMIQQAKEEGRP